MSYLPSVSRQRIALGGLLLLWSTVSAVAIQPQRWTHSTEADFAAGETEGLVITNLGDLKVATTIEALADMPEDITVIYDVIEMNGVALVAAGPEARLLAVKADQVTELMRFEGYQLFSMLPIPGTSQITLALSGETSKLTQVNFEADAASIVREIELPEVRYIWGHDQPQRPPRIGAGHRGGRQGLEPRRYRQPHRAARHRAGQCLMSRSRGRRVRCTPVPIPTA